MRTRQTFKEKAPYVGLLSLLNNELLANLVLLIAPTSVLLALSSSDYPSQLAPLRSSPASSSSAPSLPAT